MIENTSHGETHYKNGGKKERPDNDKGQFIDMKNPALNGTRCRAKK